MAWCSTDMASFTLGVHVRTACMPTLLMLGGTIAVNVRSNLFFPMAGQGCMMRAQISAVGGRQDASCMNLAMPTHWLNFGRQGFRSLKFSQCMGTIGYAMRIETHKYSGGLRNFDCKSGTTF